MHIRSRLAAAALPAILVIVGPTVVAPRAADRPTVAGPNGAVSAGHPLTSAAAFEVLLKGGNAFDAGVAAMLVGGVVEQDLYSLGGEGLVLVYPQRERKVTSVVGQGWAPKGATIEAHQPWQDLNGIGLDPAVGYRACSMRRSPCSSAGGR
jgi:gamma-glutamyltranspeptidase/glutathione hydrolase